MTRRGYTFVEVLLVLAVLAVLAGLAWPSVLRFRDEQAIKDAAERVRSELDRTRFRAIDSGLAYQFRYETDGRRFIAIPAEREALAAPAGTVTQATSNLRVYAGEVAEGLTFEPAPGAARVGEKVEADWLAGLSDVSALQQASWSPAILYRPDGTGTTAEFRLIDEDRRYIDLTVRELTGMAASGRLRKETGLWD
ncbi:MAG: prepilin-type N-terminal cleavage/methylation domain-containing protein [Planctomycetota bacterium]|nr:prepilin-type N-terminal cleavage/methylation domain-containing protein [Planctomycetaceae bacterium]MDQ3329036.1 prepilin-type N-terminal cleavage/methylation domain-containing protein [Planctomycetota bacterium]